MFQFCAHVSITFIIIFMDTISHNDVPYFFISIWISWWHLVSELMSCCKLYLNCEIKTSGKCDSYFICNLNCTCAVATVTCMCIWNFNFHCNCECGRHCNCRNSNCDTDSNRNVSLQVISGFVGGEWEHYASSECHGHRLQSQ